MIKKYIELVKPGIIRGNVVVALAVFIFASESSIDWRTLAWTILGIALVIASAAIANNLMDKNIDSKMNRTKKRALANNIISSQTAIILMAILGLAGTLLLYYKVNWLTAAIGSLGFILYVFVYGYFKRKTVHGTLIGALPGALPPLAGYTAVTGAIDWVGVLFFVILVSWQMPHFYAIAIYCKKDYIKAGLPTMPNINGNNYTKKIILGYLGGFIFFTALLFGIGLTGYTYIILMLILNMYWAKVSFEGFSKTTDKSDSLWAKKLFKVSLLILSSFSILIALNNVLP